MYPKQKEQYGEIIASYMQPAQPTAIYAFTISQTLEPQCLCCQNHCFCCQTPNPRHPDHTAYWRHHYQTHPKNH